MSKAWAKGSTRAWRKTRALVLARDGYRCQLKLHGCTTTADQVHHIIGKHAGDDERDLAAACRNCNAKVGKPTSDPPPQPRTRW